MKKTVRKRIACKELNALLQSVLDILQADDGKTFEEKKKEAIELLQGTEDDVRLAKTIINLAEDEDEAHQIQEQFWQAGERMELGDGIVLRKVNESDREHFLGVHQEYAVMKSMMENDGYRNMVWKEHSQEKGLMFSILRDNTYVGYCGIENLSRKPWEISIELHPSIVHQGIGTVAVPAMLDEIHRRLGVSEYRIRIEPTNFASQRLFEKLGAVPNGISTLLLNDPEELGRIEMEGMHLIDEQLQSVATKFSVSPQKLLSHVLEYKLLWQ